MGELQAHKLTGVALRLFWVILAIYSMLIIWAFMPVQGSGLKQALGVAFLPAVGVLAALGVAELLVVLRAGLKDKPLNIFLCMVALATIGTPASIVLHNVVSYLAGAWFGAPEEGFFFILALFICPLLFITGSIGVIHSLMNGNGSGVHSRS
ncbi:hypothetical protein KDL29_00265 [bacterium]|nr:hypothetical protein [bacterium]